MEIRKTIDQTSPGSGGTDCHKNIVSERVVNTTKREGPGQSPAAAHGINLFILFILEETAPALATQVNSNLCDINGEWSSSPLTCIQPV